MDALFSKLLGCLTGGGKLGQALADVGVDVQVASQIEDALAHNNVKLFESLMTGVLSNNELRFNVGLRNVLEAQCSGNHVSILGGDSATSLAAVAILGLATVVMVLKDAPLYVVLLLLVGVGAGWALLNTRAARVAREFQESLDRVFKRPAVEVALVQRHGQAGAFAQALLQKAGCGQEINPALMEKAVEIHAVSAMFTVADQCKKVIHVVKGRIEQGHEIFGTSNDVEGTKRKVRERVDEVGASARSIQDAMNKKIDAMAKLAEHGKKWRSQVGLILQRCRQLPKRPDFLLTPSERRVKEHLVAVVQKEVTALVTSFQDKKALFEVEDDFAYSEVETRCNELAEAMAYNSSLDKSQRQAISEAIQNRQLLSDALTKAMVAHATRRKKCESLQATMMNAQAAFDVKRLMMEQRIDRQRTFVKTLGQGTVEMTGQPPDHDQVAKTLYEHWQNARFDQLYAYRSGRFSIVFKTELTAEQRTAQKLLVTYTDELDRMKIQHGKRMEDVEREHAKMLATLPELAAAEKAAQDQVDESRQRCEKTWETFAMQYPAQYADIKLLNKVTQYVSTAARWVSEISTETEVLESLMGQLEMMDWLDVQPRLLLSILEELQRELGDPSTSCVALLRQLGGLELRKVMRPMVEDYTCAEAHLREFQSSADSVSALRGLPQTPAPALQAVSDSPDA